MTKGPWPGALKLEDGDPNYFVGWLYSELSRGPITVEVWNGAVMEARYFAERNREASEARAAEAKRNAIAARRRRS